MRQKKLIFLLLLLLWGVGFYLTRPQEPKAAGSLTSASATLSNPRLSFYSKVGTAVSAGATTIDITSGGADTTTNHLFPKDTVSVGPNGGVTVGAVHDTNTFVLESGLTVGASANDNIYATQSGTLTLTFTITNAIPLNGYVLVTLPDPASGGNDGAPDSGNLATNGFDLNGMDADNDNVTPTGGTNCTWGTETITAGGGSGHTYKVVNTNATGCTGTPTITFDGATKDLVNPAPASDRIGVGYADVYEVDISTYGPANELIDTVGVKVAPVEAVLVSATVDETLSFQVQGLATGSTACGNPADVTATAYSVPWGPFVANNTFYEAHQQLTLSTNADNGYSVKIEENDQMGKNGTTCDFPTSDTADETDNPPCIKDTVCGASACTEAAARDWTDDDLYHGLGISLQDFDGTDAVWDYDGKPAETTCTSGTFCARQIADQEAGNTKATIMTNTGSVSSKDIYVCYRIAISNTQPAGYYYNKVKYTATPIF